MKLVLALLAGLAVAGCSGGGATVAGRDPLDCATYAMRPYLTGAQMFAPADGAKNVPVTVGSVTVAYVPALVGVTVVLQPNGSSAPNGGQFPGGPFTVSGGGTTLTATIPTLTPGTTYFVQASTSEPVGNGCTRGIFWTFGTFST